MIVIAMDGLKTGKAPKKEIAHRLEKMEEQKFRLQKIEK